MSGFGAMWVLTPRSVLRESRYNFCNAFLMPCLMSQAMLESSFTVHNFGGGISEQLARYAANVDKHLKEDTVVVVTRETV